MKFSTKYAGFSIILLLIMAATRYNHFGSAFSLPDASLAVFMLAGLIFSGHLRLSLAVFSGLLLLAGGIDYYAIHVGGTSDWCVTPAYGFLLPTYAIMWFAGHWFASRFQNNWRSLLLFGSTSWLAVTFAFVVSNTGFYLFSGKFTDMVVAEYGGRVMQYYAPYVSGSLLYLALACVSYIAYTLLAKSSKSAMQD